MNAETDAFYGRPEPSRTYKWGLVLPCRNGHLPVEFPWRIVAWFPSRTAAEAYANRVHGRAPHAIARANLAEI